MRTYRKTRRNKRTRKGGDRSINHKKNMLKISKEDYPTSLALIKKKILELTTERESIFSSNRDKSIIDNEIHNLYQLGMKIREEKTGIQSLKQRKTGLSHQKNLDISQIAELKEIENKIEKIEQENVKRQRNYNTTIRLYAERQKYRRDNDNDWNFIQTRSRR